MTELLLKIPAELITGTDPFYHFEYYPGGMLTNNALNESPGGLNTATLNQTTTNPPLGGQVGVGLAQFNAGGASAMLAVRIPLSWDRSPILLNVDGLFQSGGSGSVDLFAYSAVVPIGGNPNAVTWSPAGAPVSVATPGTTFPLAHWDLTVPSAAANPGDFIFIALQRSPVDTFANIMYVLGASLGIKY